MMSAGSSVGNNVEEELQKLLQLPTEDLARVAEAITAEINLRRQNRHLKSWAAQFVSLIDAGFKELHTPLVNSFIEFVNDLQVTASECAQDSSSSGFGIIKLSVPGLPEGVTVSRSVDTFSVNEGCSLRERNEIRIKVGGLDAYSGYWLALDAPIVDHKDAWQEEGIGTLRRLISATSLPIADPLVLDAMQYPFIAALVSPFGPQAMQPFERHLSNLHRYYGHESGGSWFKVPAGDSKRNSLEQRNGFWSLTERPRAALTTFEEAELELEKLDL